MSGTGDVAGSEGFCSPGDIRSQRPLLSITIVCRFWPTRVLPRLAEQTDSEAVS